MQQQLTLKLTVEEVNIILEGLGALPYGKVYTCVANIQQQAQQQIQDSETNGVATGTASETLSESEIGSNKEVPELLSS